MNKLFKNFCYYTLTLLLIYSSYGIAQTLNKQDKEVLQGLWISYAKNSASEHEFIKLLNRGVDINTRDENGATALMWAALRGNWTLIEFLLQKGANPNIKGIIYLKQNTPDAYAGSVLSAAVISGEYSAVKILYENAKQSPFEYDLSPPNSKTQIAPIHRACLTGANAINYINLFVRSEKAVQPNVNLMAKMQQGNFSPLMMATMEGDDYVCKILLLEGADPSLKNDKGETALQIAEKLERMNVIAVLKMKASLSENNVKLESHPDKPENDTQKQLDRLATLQDLYASKGDTASAQRLASEIVTLKIQIYKKQKIIEVGEESNQTQRAIPDEYVTNVRRALKFIKGILKLIRKKNRVQYERDMLPICGMLLSMGMNEEVENFTTGFESKAMKYQCILAQKRQGKFQEAITNITMLRNELAFSEDSLKAKLSIELGGIYEELGKFEKAEEEWIAVLNSEQLRNPNSYLYRKANNKLGLMYQNTGQSEKAKIFLEESISFNSSPNNKFDFIDNDLSLIDTERETITPQKITATMVGASLGILNHKLKPYVEDSLSKVRNVFESMAEKGERPSNYFEAIEQRDQQYVYLHDSFTNSAFAGFALGNIAYVQENFTSAIAHYSKAAIMFERIWGRFNIYYWFCLSNIAQINFKTGNYHEGEYYTNVLIKNLRLFCNDNSEFTMGDIPEMLNSLKSIADYHRKVATDLNVFYDYFTFGKTQYLEEEKRDVLSVENAYNMVALANLYARLKEYKTAESLYKRALLEKGIDEENQRLAYSGLAQIEQFNRQFSEAEKHLNQALILAIKTNQLSIITDSKLKLGLFYINQKNTANATAYLNEISQELKKWVSSYEKLDQKEEKYYLARSIEKQYLMLNGAYMALMKQNQNLATVLWENVTWQKNNTLASDRYSKGQISATEIRSKLQPNSILAEYFKFFQIDDDREKVQYGVILLTKEHTAKAYSIFSENELVALLKEDSLYQKRDYFGTFLPIQGFGTIGIKKLYISAIGLLHRVSFGGLQNRQNPAIENYDIAYLNNSLWKPETKIDLAKANAILWGGLEYGKMALDSTKKLPKAWDYLHWTEKEVESLQNLLSKKIKDIKLVKGEFAIEPSFHAYNNASPSILHIATHGYFFPENQNKNQFAQTVFQKSANPLDRSGLILSKANSSWYKNESVNDPTDGILTADEVSRLNLSKTTLAVLSACQTGLGEIEGNFGVFGLQQAFKQAGVDYLLVSLWQIPDKESYEMMQLFYTNLTNNLSIETAFNNAQREMMKKYSPFYWAGFVLIR
ncbi:CHAT domain-containing protein [Runella zeae]|uniref:CHAT domain-containing protein n=1 Tax=Runella zeae TaxID=94255 RepID=UPI000422F5A0|nr:CHAT domain-containing protein [Runella zeae]